MKEIFPSLFGNERLKNSFGADFLRGTHSHAYILEGADGSGKMTAALSAAAALACENRDDENLPLPCGKCTACRKVFSKISPDLCIISAGDKKSIGVADIREIKADLYVVPNDGDFRVYIIDDAHLMTTQAQNALLISLEEPPPFAVFILLTHDSRALLETIRSRSPLFRMERFSADRIGDFLRERPEAEGILRNTEKFREICVIAAPSAGKALELAASSSKAAKIPAEEKREFALSLCKALLSSDRLSVFDTVRSFPKGRESTREILLLTMDALRDIMISKCASGGGMIFFANAEDAAALGRKTTVSRVNSLFSALDKYAELLKRNANEAIVTTLLCME